MTTSATIQAAPYQHTVPGGTLQVPPLGDLATHSGTQRTALQTCACFHIYTLLRGRWRLARTVPT